jgi:hypothetical protein
MPRYFFHVQDHTLIIDNKGEKLANDHEAIDVAQSLAFQLLNDHKTGTIWSILVVDEEGREVAKIPGLSAPGSQ